MPITYNKNRAVFQDIIDVEEAERLLEWLHVNPKGKIDLASCTHLHAANVQVLMAAKPHVVTFPADAALAAWLKPDLFQNS